VWADRRRDARDRRTEGRSPRGGIAWLLDAAVLTSVIVGVKSLAQLETIWRRPIWFCRRREIARWTTECAHAEYPGWMVARQNKGRRPDQP